MNEYQEHICNILRRAISDTLGWSAMDITDDECLCIVNKLQEVMNLSSDPTWHGYTYHVRHMGRQVRSDKSASFAGAQRFAIAARADFMARSGIVASHITMEIWSPTNVRHVAVTDGKGRITWRRE